MEKILEIIDEMLKEREDFRKKSMSFYTPAQIEVLEELRAKVSRVELPVKTEIAEELIEEMASDVADVIFDMDEHINYANILESWKLYFRDKLSGKR